MPSKPIEWHEQCHRNATANLERKRAELARLTAEIDRDAANLDLRARQIAEAKKRGLKSFDNERLLKSRK